MILASVRTLEPDSKLRSSWQDGHLLSLEVKLRREKSHTTFQRMATPHALASKA